MPVFYATSKDMSLKMDNVRAYLDYLLSVDGKKLVVNIEQEKWVRSKKQNDSLHLYFSLLAKSLNDAGLGMKKVLKDSVEINWNTNLVKEYLWRPMQKAITGKMSTKELDKTSEITEIWEHLNRHFGEKYGIYVAFPKKDDSRYMEYPTASNKTAFD